MSDVDPNDMVYCPYDKAHKMLRKKLQQHIIKCREYFKDEIELMVCPFNKAHLIPEPEFFQHTKTCDDRKIIAHYQHNAAAELVEDTKHEKIETEENWDDDDVPDYDPEAYASNANVLRSAKGIFPAQRKAFVKEERKRLLEEQSDDDTANDNINLPQAMPIPTRITTSTSNRSAPYKLSNRQR
ncbi:gametocyte-specific factor 1 homolog [Drosophila albomicans]|uniref:Gametocyte-specific factor 1 homolog n=1 Tax=Drosophila albomicans TaxID=7291 RepID=A0A6P8XEJ7_DROAB|nr:gametocyte-specific factor 1 homolog [Drosophila albomicans]